MRPVQDESFADPYRTLQLNLEDYADEGLYLHFEDGQIMALTRDFIQTFAQSFLADAVRLPAEVRSAAAYQPCTICPKRRQAEICHAILPVLPFAEAVEPYKSHDSVIAVYRGSAQDRLDVAWTTVASALQYVSMLSLLEYCEVGRKYRRYYVGISPLTRPDEVARRVYLSMYWHLEGDYDRVVRLIKQFNHELYVISGCQVARVQLMCQSDAFCNAFVDTQASALLLQLDLGKSLGNLFREDSKLRTGLDDRDDDPTSHTA